MCDYDALPNPSKKADIGGGTFGHTGGGGLRPRFRGASVLNSENKFEKKPQNIE